MAEQPWAVCIMGPTASGKTDLALALARRFPMDVISVDSALVYRGMDIGTAKPSKATLSEVPHRLVDILDPREAYSAARFRSDAIEHMQEIQSLGRMPLLVGGTMLYFRALEEGLSPLPAADPQLRARLGRDAARLGHRAMHERLRRVDAVSAERIHPNDPQRILRALEIHEITGRAMSALLSEGTKQALPFRLLKLVVATADRSCLHERIEARFRHMLELGFVHEVEKLRARSDLNLRTPAMRAVGYRQVWEYLDGVFSRYEMEKRGIIATRQLARRQLTWLRGERGTRWLDSTGTDILTGAVAQLTEIGIPAEIERLAQCAKRR